MAKKASPVKRKTPPRSSPTARPEIPPAADSALLRAMSLRGATRDDESAPLTNEEIERALISGEHARVLETYFGETEYAELAALAAGASRRARRGGPRVLILPGICGSYLARMQGRKADRLWVDFWDISRGRLTELALPDSGKTISATDAHPGTYLKLKLWLRAEGFDADDHPYDWRRTIPDLGRELAKRVADEPASEIYLVAHSMGGLVARAALAHGLPKLKHLIMLGTPNYGSFAPVMVFRGIYKFLKTIALLDLAHNAKELAGFTFNTFAGLTEMMPQREKFSAVNLYDINAWPKKGPLPLPALLGSTPGAQARLALPAAEKATLIAGVDQKTVTSLSLQRGEFVFEQTRNGDGTVPLDFAVLPGLDTYYVREGHGELPKNRKVWQAVKEIMSGKRPASLENKWSASRSGITRVTESELDAAEQPAATCGEDLRPSDMRGFLEEFLTAGRLPDVSVPAILTGETDAPFQSLVVGRRRQRRVEIRLAHGSLTQAKSRAYVVGLFQDVPPAGASMAIDAAMDGAITDFSQRRMFSNAVGEIFLLPRGRNDLRADFVIFAGLGAVDRFDAQVIETVAENLARSLVHIEIEEFATILVGANAGVTLENGVSSYVRGFLRGLVDTDREEHFRAITLCEIDDARFNALKWSLYRLSSTSLFNDVEITLSEIDLPPAPAVVSAPARGIILGSVPTIYLHVRSERMQRNGWRFCSSVLTSGARATVIGGEIEVSAGELDEHLDRIEQDTFGYATLPEFGAKLAQLVLPSNVIAAIEGSLKQHVVVVHDAGASRIPWETLSISGRALALEAGMSRRYIASNMSVAKWLEQRRQQPNLHVLLVVNPTGDLAGAVKEGNRVEQLCVGTQQVSLTRIVGAEATRARLLEEFGSGGYDVLHYAGHAFFDPDHVSRSGLLCSDGHLTGTDLAGLAKLPSLVFFNACESARVRKNLEKTPHTTKNLHERIERNVGLAEAFLRGGVANFLGTYWPVGDDAAEAFAGEFYTALLKGEALGHAVQKARLAVDQVKSPDWADYVQYGSFEFALKRGEN